MAENSSLPQLTAEEIRVLGSLIEKCTTTPDYYPMTINAITTACNQKTSRHPVVEYSEETVLAAVKSLKAQSLVSMAIGGGSRAVKYKHNFLTLYPLLPAELAILCLLFLRGPQTPGELNTNSARLHEFSSLASVHEVLDKLANTQPPFIAETGKRAGQKETRYCHLFGESVESEEVSSQKETPVKQGNDLELRLAAVEKELAQTKEDLARIMKELGLN